MTHRFAALLLGFLLSAVWGDAQSLKRPDYPQGYFRNPLTLPMDLSGNFGEVRKNHFHMGLDLRTRLRENYPVYAAAGGFISRIKIEPGGFGRALYLQHPNGYTTVYAHLNAFTPAVEQWVKEQQYRFKSWKLDLQPGRNRFPVKKGDFLAQSGNTGGSEAPHLHFEIRTTEGEVNLNPIFFGFPYTDNYAPQILKLGIFDRTRSTYEQNPQLLSVKPATAHSYQVNPSTILVDAPRVSLAVAAVDRQRASSNSNGIAAAQLNVDGKPRISFLMDRISYGDTRYVNAHIDFGAYSRGGAALQHLSALPGNIPSIYQHTEGGDGVIDLQDGQLHRVKIVVWDGSANEAAVTFSLKWTGKRIPQATAYPGQLFRPNVADGFEADDCAFSLGENSLYDSAHIAYRKIAHTDAEHAIAGVHAIGRSDIPLQDPMLVRIRPVRALTTKEKDHTLMQGYSGARKEVQKVVWEGEWASARFRDFGHFRLLTDTVPPEILPQGFTDGSNLSGASRIVFTVKDNQEKCKNVYTELDGQWIRFTNDKGRLFIYTFDEHCPRGPHVLRIRAEDEAGNSTERQFRFTR